MSFHCVGWVVFVKLVKHFGFIDTVCSNHMTEMITSAKKKSKIHNKSLTPILLVLRIPFSSLQVAHIHYMWLCYVDKSILKASTLYITAASSMWPHLFASLHMTVYRNAKCWSVSIFLSSLFQQPSHCVIETGQRADLSEEEMMNVISETRCCIYFTVCMIIINCQYLRITILCLYARSFYSVHVLMRCKISYCDNNAVPNFYHLALWD